MNYVLTIFMTLFLVTTLPTCRTVEASPTPTVQSPAAQADTPDVRPESTATQDLTFASPPEEPEMSNPITPDAAAEQMITLVKQHLAQRLNIAADQILVSDLRQVVWRDAGLGCAKLGVDYVQVETPGYRIVLEAQGQTYNYHTDQTRRFVPCRT
jgi:hypothetical protein